MNVSVTGPFIYFTIPVFGGIPITQTTVSSLVVTVTLIIVCILLGKQVRKRPDGKQVLVEKGVMLLYNMVTDTMGQHNAHWTPFIITLFLSSICGSLIGMTGFLRSTTADLSTPLTWAVMVSVIIWYQNIKTNGFLGWLKGFTEPVAVMTPMNIISEFAQPVSMAFRHFGNVAGGSVITGILYTALAGLSSALLSFISGSVIMPILLLAVGTLLLWKKKRIWAAVCAVLGILGVLQYSGLVSGIPIFQFGIPAVLSVYFDLFSAFVQALVFSLLTMVYVAGACPEPSQQDNQ